jgi:hypothetical protein
VLGRSRRRTTRGQTRQEIGKQPGYQGVCYKTLLKHLVYHSHTVHPLWLAVRGGVDGESDAVALGLDRTSFSFGHVAAHVDLFWTQTCCLGLGPG